MLTLSDVFEALTGTRTPQTPLVISEAAIDSRQVIPGSLFVALPGERVNGLDFVGDAFQRGAHLALVEKDLSESFPTVDLRHGPLPGDAVLPPPPFCLLVEDSLKAMQNLAGFWRSRLKLRVVGITGSVGKSTTKEMVAEVLSQRYHVLKNVGNLNNEIGLPLTILRLGPGYDHAVLEMGFYVPGEISFLCGIAKPQIGVLTNIGTVHAERAGSQEVIALGKRELVEALPPAPEGVAVLNYDDPFIRPMAEHTQARVFYYGLDPAADLWADNIEGLGLEGVRFQLHYHNEVLHLRVPMIGRHSVHTVLRAAAVGLVEDLTWQEIVTGLQSGHMQLRLVAVHTASGALILDDTYNASPESTLAALNLLHEMEGHRVAVLGDMLELGPYERAGHEMVGVRAAEVCSELVTVGERSKMIAGAALKAGLDSKSISEFDEVEQAISFLQGRLKEGDVVLVKGSHGMRLDRLVTSLEVVQ